MSQGVKQSLAHLITFTKKKQQIKKNQKHAILSPIVMITILILI
nr:hypothetical protein [Klebsiella pneumoniae]